MEAVQIIKGYELRERIGSGGFGVVHRAYQSTIGREVAIKIILPHYANHPDFIRRFEAEAQLIAQLEHPHIVPLYDYWRDPDGAYLVMRWLRGGNLHEALQQSPFDLERAALLIDQITSALALAHRNGIIHRDLKPANILLDEDGNAYLSDFGIANVILDATSEQPEIDTILGSPDYLSPEQARGEPASPQTDIYSLGVVLYEILTGRYPFPTRTPVERLYHHLNDPLPLITTLTDEVTGGVNTIIQKATAKNPANRYADVLEIAAAFRHETALTVIRASESLVEQLTLREQEVLQLLISGYSNQEIADELVITPGTVKWYLSQLYGKLRVRSRVQAIVRARELNLIVPSEAGEPLDTETPYVLRPEPENPYKGLRAFQPADARDFFGREKLVSKLIARLAEKNGMSRFLAVVGPSGSGKSSVVKAGLIPALWRGELPGSDRWFVVEVVPGPRPLDELEIALTRVAAHPGPNLREHLERDQHGLLRVAGLILPDDGSELVLVIDQFEELFTLVEDEAARAHVLDLIQAAVTDPRSRVRVVVTLRADFYDRPLHYPAFGELMRTRMETVLPLSAEELEAAVIKPAERVGVSFEPGLVTRIVSDVHYQPGALPLLQYALTELFEQREQLTLTQAAYQASGGAVGTLAKRADDVYCEQDAAGRDAIQQMFLRLVTLDEDATETRRRVFRSELLNIATTDNVMDEVIDTYAAYRLLTLDHDPATRKPTVEMAHEAILREWQRLRDWLDESRHDIRQQRLLSAAAAEWQHANRESSYLLSGAKLEQFEGWAAETRLALTQDERDYLKQSVAENERQATAERDRQERELETQRQLVEQQRHAANRLRYLVAGLGVFLAVAIGLAIFALDRERRAQDARQQAEREAEVNHSLVLANEAEDVRGVGQTDLALMLAMQALAVDDPPQEAVRALRDIALSTGLRANLPGHSYKVQAMAFSPDGRTAVSASCAELVAANECIRGEIIVWNVSGDAGQAAEIERIEAHDGWVHTLAFVPGTSTLISGGGDGKLLTWDADPESATFGALQNELAAYPAAVRSLAISPDGTLLALALQSDTALAVVEASTGNSLHTLAGHTGPVSKVIFAPDGQFILSASDDATMILWDAATGEKVRVFEGHTAAVNDIVFSPDGTTILSRSADLTARLWDVPTGTILRTHKTLFGLGCIGISPDGRLAYVCEKSTTGVWDVAQWSQVDTFLMTAAPEHHSLAVSPDSSYLLAGSDAGAMALLNTSDRAIVHNYAAEGVVPGGGIAITPDGRKLIMGTYGTDTLIWDTETHEIVRRLDAQGLGANAITVSPDGKWAVVSTSDFLGGTRRTSIGVWDIESGEMISQFDGFEYWPKFQAFAPDGRTILGGSFTVKPNWDEENLGEIVLWEAATGEEILRFDYHDDLACVDITRDGTLGLVGSAHAIGEISLWDIDPESASYGESIWRRKMEPLPSAAMDCQFARDDRTYFMATNLGTVEQRDVMTDRLIQVFSGHDGWVLHLDISPDGQQLLSAGRDGNIVLWDIASGHELRRFTGHTAGIWEVIFSPDGQYAFSSSFDMSVLQWRIANWSVDELLAWIRDNRYVREFTCEERAQYRIEPLCE